MGINAEYMGTVFRSQPPESDTRLPADISTTMQFSAIITFSMVLFFFASLTEAGVNQFGACYCSTRDCTVVSRGIYRTRCDPGYTCQCDYNSNLGYCFGACTSSFGPPTVAEFPNGSNEQ